MRDMTKNKVAFGLLGKKAQKAILDAWPDGVLEYYLDRWKDTKFEFHGVTKNQSPDNLRVYRLKTAPEPTKPSVDWSHVADDLNWLATHPAGFPTLSSNQPKIMGRGWLAAGHFVRANVFASYTPGTCDWRDSLVKRPGYEGK